MKILKMFLNSPALVSGSATGYEEDLVSGNHHPLTEKTKEEIFKLAKEARIIAVRSDLLDKALASKEDTGRPSKLPPVSSEGARCMMTMRREIEALLERPLSPPFKVCWFETFNPGSREIPLKFFEVDLPHKKTLMASAGMLVHEIAPGIFDVFALEVVPHEKHITYQISVLRNMGAEYKPTSDQLSHLALRMWTRAIEIGTMAMEETEDHFMIPRGHKGKTKPFRINRIVHVVPRSCRGKSDPLTPKGVVDWSHRWEVQGHWRKVNGIGKNREGEYVEEGWTWVMEHIRGPEEKELVIKTRIVGGREA